MIPEYLRVNQTTSNYILLNGKSFFEKAEEFVELQTKFIKETFYEKLSLWVDMIISPLITLVMCLYSKELPSVFTMISLQKVVSLWYDWVRFKIMAQDVGEWVSIVRSVGGPFISTNDPTYHVYVYADGMERLRNSLFRFSKKGAKRF
jgi:hypothetical protein